MSRYKWTGLAIALAFAAAFYAATQDYVSDVWIVVAFAAAVVWAVVGLIKATPVYHE